MPAESSRLARRLGARDRRFLAVLACAVAVAVPALVLLEGTNSGPDAPAGHCVTESRASIMGAANYTYCGKQADAECAHPATASEAFAAQCRRIGVPAE